MDDIGIARNNATLQPTLRWQRLPRMLQMQNNSSSHKQAFEMRPKRRPFNENRTSKECDRMGSKWRTLLNEAKYQGVYRNWRKHYVGFYERNQAIARIGVEQDVDLVMKKLKLKLLRQPHDEVLLTRDRRLEHYNANGDHNIHKNWLFFRKMTENLVIIQNYQFLMPKQLVL